MQNPRGLAFAGILASLLALPTGVVAADDIAPRAGWAVYPSGYDYETLASRVRASVKTEGLAVVTRAGPTSAAKARGIDIPGNMVIGAFNNLFAVRILELSTAAMIEAPVRLYVTENTDGSATVSYKLPSAVFAPYADEGGPALAEAAAELDVIFEAIASSAAAP
ncbi:MAG: DUF302 domain-containing protein [Pseudomonadota bacterium]